MINLSTQQLHYLVAVADADTWADAAAELGVSGSALSQGILQLERRVGLPLFDREGRKRVLLPGAEPVLGYARSVVAQTRELTRWVEAAARAEAGHLRVGMIDLAATVHFGSALHRFGQRRPEVDLHLAVGPSGFLCEELLAGRLSVVVVVEPTINSGELELTPLLEDELAVYGPDTNASASAGPDISHPDTSPASGASDAPDLDVPPAAWGPWVTFPVGSHTRTLVAERLNELGASFDVVAESHQPEVLRGMVALGMGWTVLPVLQAETEPNPLRRARPEPIINRRLVAARRQGAIPDPLAEAFIRELLDTLD